MATKISLIFLLISLFLISINIFDTICGQNKIQTPEKLEPKNKLLIATGIKFDNQINTNSLNDRFPGLFNQNLIKSNKNKVKNPKPTDYDYVSEMAGQLQLPELVLIAEYNLMENFLSDLNILKILFKAKNKTTKNDRKYLRNKIIDFINRKLIYNKPVVESVPYRKFESTKTCIEKPFTFIKEVRFK